MAFLTLMQLQNMGFRSLGTNVLISDKVSLYGVTNITIGSNVRIDDFCILSAGGEGIELGSYVHIACYCSLIGKAPISLGDFSGLSSRVSIYSSSDDYSGCSMTNPMVPEAYTSVDHRPVEIGRHSIVGAGTVILPGVTLGEGCAIGALSLVTKDCTAFGIYSGVPARLIKRRDQGLLELEKQLHDQQPKAQPLAFESYE